MTGWEPAEVTTHYTPDGEVTGYSVTVREPEWSPDDVAALAASRREEFARRGAHGFKIPEATDPANNGQFEVDIPSTDFAAAALKRAQDKYFGQYPDAKGDPSLVWNVRRRQPPQPT